MENIIENRSMTSAINQTAGLADAAMNLAQGRINIEYTIKDIETNDGELKHFLFTLGCYEGESITVISKLAENFVIAVKDARYSIDKDLAEAIII